MPRNRLIILLASLLLTVASLVTGCDSESVDNITPKTPDYTLKVINENGTVYTDLMILRGPGIKVNHNRIKVVAETKQRQYTVIINKKNAWYKADAEGKFELTPGSNELGIWIFDLERSDQEAIDRGIWIRVFYKSPNQTATIKPAVLEGDTDTFYTFTATTETVPVVGSYEWKLDGKLLGKGGGATLTRKFSEPGTFKLTVVIYDEFFKEPCGEGEAVATITERPKN